MIHFPRKIRPGEWAYLERAELTITKCTFSGRRDEASGITTQYYCDRVNRYDINFQTTLRHQKTLGTDNATELMVINRLLEYNQITYYDN